MLRPWLTSSKELHWNPRSMSLASAQGQPCLLCMHTLLSELAHACMSNVQLVSLSDLSACIRYHVALMHDSSSVCSAALLLYSAAA